MLRKFSSVPGRQSLLDRTAPLAPAEPWEATGLVTPWTVSSLMGSSNLCLTTVLGYENFSPELTDVSACHSEEVGRAVTRVRTLPNTVQCKGLIGLC